MTLAGERDLGVREHHGQGRAAQALAHFRVAGRILARDAAFVGRLVQQRRVRVGVARDEDGRVARLHGFAVEHRHALRVQRQ
ncbi:hypothetical protein D9M72_144200 [compost metagenome]